MKLPSGIELPREKVEELCEVLIREKFQLECTFAEAFDMTAIDLSEGNIDGVPALEQGDIVYLREVYRKIVFQCVEGLNEHLKKFFEGYVSILDW